jgi:hypothetical protein
MITKLIMWMLTKQCPNCVSAWTGGNPNPEKRRFCVVCSNPSTGTIRGWVWRFNYIHRLLVTNNNFRSVKW